MVAWSQSQTSASAINNGNEYSSGDNLSVEALNAIANNTFYAITQLGNRPTTEQMNTAINSAIQTALNASY